MTDPTPTYEITVDRRFTIKVFGTLEGFIALADDIETLDTLDGGDATGLIVGVVSNSETGTFTATHEGTTVTASYDDGLYDWTPRPAAPAHLLDRQNAIAAVATLAHNTAIDLDLPDPEPRVATERAVAAFLEMVPEDPDEALDADTVDGIGYDSTGRFRLADTHKEQRFPYTWGNLDDAERLLVVGLAVRRGSIGFAYCEGCEDADGVLDVDDLCRECAREKNRPVKVELTLTRSQIAALRDSFKSAKRARETFEDAAHELDSSLSDAEIDETRARHDRQVEVEALIVAQLEAQGIVNVTAEEN